MTNKTKNKKSSIITFSMPIELEPLLKHLEIKTNQKRSTLLRNLLISELKSHSLLPDSYQSNPTLGRPKKQ